MDDHVDGSCGAALPGPQPRNRGRNLCDDQAAGAFAVEFTQYVGDSVTGLTGRLNDGLELPLKPCESRPDEVRVCFYTLDVEVEELAEDRL
jgi:hypothetical protein